MGVFECSIFFSVLVVNALANIVLSGRELKNLREVVVQSEDLEDEKVDGRVDI